MRRILLILLMFAAVSVSAQQDKKAKDILDLVSEKTRSFNCVIADFAYTLTNPEMEDFNERSEGTIKIKGQKYTVNLPDVGINIFSNGEILWTYMKDGNQVTISNIEDEGSELMDPSSLLSIYEKGFESKFVSEKKEGNKSIYELELFPDVDEYEVSKITVYIDKATHLIHAATLFGTDGNEYGIEVNKMETNHDFPDSDFVFDASKYPDIEEIDFR